jgi:nucleotide-binding universal stress UspA family protein
MIEIRRILCPVDFSDFSKRSVAHGLAVARRYGSTVTVLHVIPPIPPIAYAAGVPPLESTVLTDEEREELKAKLLRFAEPERPSGVSVEAVVREGETVPEILAEAASMDADLLALGTHGRSGFERVLLGSVTEKLLRKARCPVLTVPLSDEEPAPGAPEIFKRVLCPVDFSECSTAALKYALSIAQENDAELVVLYVVPSDFVPLPGQPKGEALDQTISVADFFIKREQHARRMLNDAVPEAARTYCSVDTLMAHGKPSTEILRLAGERRSDVIVIGVRGRGAADLAFFGSTTQQVVRQAACPVLTIRQG